MHKHTCQALLSAFQNAVDAARETEEKIAKEKDMAMCGWWVKDYKQILGQQLKHLNNTADEYIRDDMAQCTCND